MRIAIVNLYRGGMLHYISGLTESLLAARPETSVACFVPDDTHDELFDARVALYRYAVPSHAAWSQVPSALGMWLSCMKLAGDVVAWAPDVLHINSGHILFPFLLPRWSRSMPVVSTLHDVNPHPGERPWLKRMKGRPVVSHSRCIMVHGERLREQASKQFGISRDRIFVSPIPVAAVQLGLTGEVQERKGELLMFGRILEYKGFDTLIDSMGAILERHPEARFTIAGEGDLSPWQANLHRFNGSVRVINRFVDEEEAARLFAEASLVLLPYT